MTFTWKGKVTCWVRLHFLSTVMNSEANFQMGNSICILKSHHMTLPRADTTTGFICKNEDQPDHRCFDYRVRFVCHPPFCNQHICWSRWFDLDNPSGTGDWETLSSLRKKYPGAICDEPLYIEAVTVDTRTPALATGQNFYIFNPTTGFVCRNSDQTKKGCLDYKVRFGCCCNP
ncbi:unnamed protein product [Boreogadus saida]